MPLSEAWDSLCPLFFFFLRKAQVCSIFQYGLLQFLLYLVALEVIIT